MATKARATSNLPARRTGGTVSKARFSAALDRAKNAGKRLRDATRGDDDAMVGVGAGLVLAIAEKKTTLPTVAGLDPAVLYGAVGYALARKSKNKQMGMVRQASIAMLTVGVNRSYSRGSIKVGEDTDEEEDEL